MRIMDYGWPLAWLLASAIFSTIADRINRDDGDPVWVVIWRLAGFFCFWQALA